MKISILGGGGFLGRKIAKRLATEGVYAGQTIEKLTLFDIATPPAPVAPFPVAVLGGDIVELPEAAVPSGTNVIFHLAAVVSAQAEADYDLGRRVNLRGTDSVVDACRRLVALGDKPPRVVFTSSVASFSATQADTLADDAKQVPGNSYGAQKAAAELILADASRRGFMDVVSVRLPTVTVRPGRPNKAASSFFSGIVREPLLGLEAELPVPDNFAVWVCSPRRAVEWLMHAGAMNTGSMGLDRSVSPPGIKTTVGEMLRAMDDVRQGSSSLVRRVADPTIEAIVSTWPAAFTADRAKLLGFAPHEPFVDVVRAFIQDDLDDTRRERGLPAETSSIILP